MGQKGSKWCTWVEYVYCTQHILAYDSHTSDQGLGQHDTLYKAHGVILSYFQLVSFF